MQAFPVLYYALVAPWVRRPVRDGELTYTRESGLRGLLFAAGLVVVFEGVGVHFLLVGWSPRVAWVHAALDAYAILWLVAVGQAARLRPVLVTADELLVRASLLWTVEIPRATIASIESIVEAPRDKRVLRAALGTSPVLLVTLSAPVVARGPFGIRRSVDRVALYVDDPAALRAAL
jgi:hypothetical protein